jgi:hypothetical protein
MRKVGTFVWIGIWLLTFAGRSPERNHIAEKQPAVVDAPSLASDSAELATSAANASLEAKTALPPHPENGRTATSHQGSKVLKSGNSNKNHRQKDLLWAFFAAATGVGIWRMVRGRAKRQHQRKPTRPMMVKWLAYTLGILAVIVLIGLGWFASLAILGLTFAMAGWFSLGIVASLVSCILLALGLFWVFDNADFDWPRGFLAKVFLFILLIPLFVGIILTLAALSFFLFLNVFLAPPVGFFAAVAVMGTMMSAIALSLAVWEAITESVEE